MKSYKEIEAIKTAEYEVIEGLKEQLEAVSEEREGYIRSLVPNGTRFEQLKAAKDDVKVLDYDEQEDKIRKKIGEKNLIIRVLCVNAIIAMFKETIPSIVSILNRYKGKKIGEKRKNEIREEIKKETNVSIYRTYSGLDVYMSSHCHFEVYLSGEWFDSEGKLNERKEEDFELPCHYKYIEDVEAYIRDIRGLAKQIAKANKDLNALIKVYNDKAIEGFPDFTENYNSYIL